MYKWFYFNGERFIPTDVVKFKDGRWVTPKDFWGKVLFRASTARRGRIGCGILYLASPEGLLKLGHPENVPLFIRLFAPHVLSSKHMEWLERLLDWREKVKELVPYGKNVVWTQAIGEFLEKPINYLGRLLCKKDRDKGLEQVEKLLYQLYVLFKIPGIMRGEIISDTIFVEQDMSSGIRWLDSMMPVTWNEPTFKFRTHNGEIYSVWHEFSAPYPLSPELKKKALTKTGNLLELWAILRKSSNKRFDIIVQKGDHDTMFLEKPWDIYEKLEAMNWEERIEIRDYFFKKMKRIDLLIKCKERPFIEWKSDVETRIVLYYKTYKPRKMALISAYSIPQHVKLKLEDMGIIVIAPLRPDEAPHEQELKLKKLIEEL